MHEDAFDWPVVPPLQEYDSEDDQSNNVLQALKFGEATDVSHFITTMKQIQTHFEYEDPVSKQRKSWVKFFIASNSLDTKKLLLQHFPGSVAITEDYPRNHADGVVVAFLDWLLLSKSALILHSHGSTFAEEAGIKSHSPIVSQVASRLVLHHSNLLPYCGIMYYMDFDIVPVEQVGVVDDEPKKYGKINLRLCGDRLSHWGLSEVYCATFE